MPKSAATPNSSSDQEAVRPVHRAQLMGAAIILILATCLAYGNSFSGQFVFDDNGSITGNPTLRHLGRLSQVLSPPAEQTVGGRPLLNLTLAINYAVSGTRVWSYHAVNLAIHVLAALTLMGIVRRTLGCPGLKERFGSAALPLAFLTALLWSLHPLQTESVTYVIQRAESLMGLLYLLTLYCFIRGQESHVLRDMPSTGRARGWLVASVAACFLGMASKEVMVSAPLIVLLYDRTFVTGTFAAAWKKRRGFYLALAATWILLAGLVAGTSSRGGSAGFGTGPSPWSYALTQCGAIVHYLRLCLWPHPLVMDHGTGLVQHAGQVFVPACLLLALVALTFAGLQRRSPAALAGIWFFALLAPSSSVVPVATQTVAEHRMYLALAAVLVLAVLAMYSWVGRRSLPLLLVLAVGLGTVAFARNRDYRTELSIWSDTVAKRPDNARAQNNLGKALVQAGRPAEAVPHYEESLRLDPSYFEAHDNLGIALLQLERTSEAIAQFKAALHTDPQDTEALGNLGLAYSKTGRMSEAIACYTQVLALKPSEVNTRVNLGNALVRTGRLAEAIAWYEEALRNDPGSAAVHYNLGHALAQAGRFADAIPHYEWVLQQAPGDAEARAALDLARQNARR